MSEQMHAHPSDIPQETKPLSLNDVAQDRDQKKLAKLYDLKRNEEKGKVEHDTHAALRDLAKKVTLDQVEEKMVQRVPDTMIKAVYKGLADIQKEKITPQEKSQKMQKSIDGNIKGILTEIFGLSLSDPDLQKLRDDLPIMDGLTDDGRFLALGSKGNAHAVVFDGFDMEQTKEGYQFVYHVYVDTDQALQSLVRQSVLNLGSSRVAGHQFKVLLRAEASQEKKEELKERKLPEIREVPANTPDLVEKTAGGKKERHDGVTITNADGSKTILISRTAKDKANTLKHELSHMLGMVSESENMEEDGAARDAMLKADARSGHDDREEQKGQKEYQSIRSAIEDGFSVQSFNEKKNGKGNEQGWEDLYGIELGLSGTQLANIKDAFLNVARFRNIDINREISFTDLVGEVPQLKGDLEANLKILVQKLSEVKNSITINRAAYFNGPKLKWEFISKSTKLSTLLGSSAQLTELFKSSDFSGALSSTGIKEELIHIYQKEAAPAVASQQEVVVQQTQKPEVVSQIAAATTFDALMTTIDPSKKIEGTLAQTVVTASAVALTAKTEAEAHTEAEKFIRDRILAATSTQFSAEVRNKIVELYYKDKVKPVFSTFPEGGNQFIVEKNEQGECRVKFSKQSDTPAASEQGVMAGIKDHIQGAYQKFGEIMQAKGPGAFFEALGAAITVLFGALFSKLFGKLGEKIGLKFEQKDADLSRAAFEKVKQGDLPMPTSADFFKKQIVPKPAEGKTWEDSWKDFLGSAHISAYVGVAKGKGIETGVLLEEAAAFKATGKAPTEAEAYFKSIHNQAEITESDNKAKNEKGIKEAWKQYGIAGVEIDADSFSDAMGLKNAPKLDDKKEPKIAEYKSELDKLFTPTAGEANAKPLLGGVDGIKQWGLLLASKHEPLKFPHVQLLQLLESQKNEMGLVPPFTIASVKFVDIATSYGKELTGGKTFTMDAFIDELKAGTLSWSDKGTILKTNTWPKAKAT